MSNFRELRVWQRAMDLVECVYAFARTLPAEERFGLCTQLQRAVVSIPSNTAEGHSRHRLGAYVNHVTIALGSTAELETLFEVCRRLRFGDPDLLRACETRSSEVGRMLQGLHHSLERSLAARRGLVYSILLVLPGILYLMSFA